VVGTVARMNPLRIYSADLPVAADTSRLAPSGSGKIKSLGAGRNDGVKRVVSLHRGRHGDPVRVHRRRLPLKQKKKKQSPSVNTTASSHESSKIQIAWVSLELEIVHYAYNRFYPQLSLLPQRPKDV